MTKKRLSLFLAAGVIAVTGGNIALALLFDQNVTPDAIFGGGNANGSYTVDLQGGVELGLRGKLRFNAANMAENTFNSNGDGTYSFPAILPPVGFGFCPGCPTTPVWNFEWSVNTNQDGSTGLTLDDLTYEIGLDFDPSQCTNFLAFDPITPGVAAPFWDHSTGTNATPNGGGAEAANVAAYVAALAANNVAQNSWSYEFFNNVPFDTFDPTDDGTYDVYLRAFDAGGGLVAETSIQIIAGMGGAPCIGACCTDGPGTQSDCVETTAADCASGGGLYLGDNLPCAGVLDCVPLLVEFDTMTAQATPQGVVVRWSTVTEIDTMGFRVLRESGARDKALKVVAALIPAAGHGLAGASYEVLDNARIADPAVRYYVEDIDINGKVTRHGPIEVQPMTRRQGSARTR